MSVYFNVCFVNFVFSWAVFQWPIPWVMQRCNSVQLIVLITTFCFSVKPVSLFDLQAFLHVQTKSVQNAYVRPHTTHAVSLPPQGCHRSIRVVSLSRVSESIRNPSTVPALNCPWCSEAFSYRALVLSRTNERQFYPRWRVHAIWTWLDVRYKRGDYILMATTVLTYSARWEMFSLCVLLYYSILLWIRLLKKTWYAFTLFALMQQWP